MDSRRLFVAALVIPSLAILARVRVVTLDAVNVTPVTCSRDLIALWFGAGCGSETVEPARG